MKKTWTLILFVMIVATQVFSQKNDDFKEIIGEWKYETPEAANSGYDVGVIIISKKEGKLNGVIEFTSGYKIDVQDVVYKDHVLTFGLYIDYDYITVKGDVSENKLEGTVKTPEGEMGIKAERKKKKKKNS